jgi:hypothetical protein
MAMQALSRSRALFQTVDQGDTWKSKVEEVRTTVSRELDALTRNAPEAGATARWAALEQVCASSSLVPLLVSGFSALGDQGGEDFFIDFIRHMNGDKRESAS